MGRRSQTADRTRAPAASLVAVVVALVAVAGCGGGTHRTIPHVTGATLIRQLKEARTAAGHASKCDELRRAISAAEATIASLPRRVDHDTRATLTNGIKNLDATAQRECTGVRTNTQTTPTATTATTQTTAPTTTQTTPPTTTTQTTPTQTTPTQTTPPANGGTPPGQQKKDKKLADTHGPGKHGGKHK